VDPATGKVETMEGVYLFWFVSEDKLTSEHRERIWWMAKDLVTWGELQRWAYVIAFSICKPGETEPTYRRMVRFLTAAAPVTGSDPVHSMPWKRAGYRLFPSGTWKWIPSSRRTRAGP
jgi:hypothetical protein